MRGRIVFYSLLLVFMFSFQFCTRQTTYMVKTEVDLAYLIHLNPFWISLCWNGCFDPYFVTLRKCLFDAYEELLERVNMISINYRVFYITIFTCRYSIYLIVNTTRC